jgi:phosphonate transport system substrate-binding protein
MNTINGVLAGFLLVLSSAASAADAPSKPLRFTAIPDHNATELKQKYDPVARYLSTELGITVEYVAAADYQASVEMFKNGDVLLAWFGGLTGVQAREAVPGARAIVQGTEDPDYYSYFIAHESTGLERSEDFPIEIASLPFSFGSESSTSGRLMPEFFIHEQSGKSPKEFFSEPFGFSGSHPKTAELVADGTKVKAGVLNYKTYDSMVADGRIDPKVCRIVWKTPHYADYNFTAHPDIDAIFGAGTIEKLQAALTGITNESLLAAFQRSGLINASNEEFDGIKNVARDLGMLR